MIDIGLPALLLDSPVHVVFAVFATCLVIFIEWKIKNKAVQWLSRILFTLFVVVPNILVWTLK